MVDKQETGIETVAPVNTRQSTHVLWC